MDATEGEAGERLHPLRLFFDPLAHAGGVPMEDRAPKEGTENGEDDPVAIQRGADGRGGNVVKVARAVAKAEPDRFGAVAEELKHFPGTKFADVVAGSGELRVDVKDLDAVILRGESGKKQLGHIALAVERRRRLREHDEFHPDALRKTKARRGRQ